MKKRLPDITIRNKAFWLTAGRDYWGDRPFKFSLVIWPRPELMTRADEGRVVLCMAAFEITWGPNFWFRNDVDEIASRMAGPGSRL
jgi:hypothetical protein